MTNKKNKRGCVILGAGGHARVVLDCLEAVESIEAICILDADSKLWGKEIFGIPIRGDDGLLGKMNNEKIGLFFVGIGSVKETTMRQKIFEKGLAAGLQSFVLIHPKAICSRRVEVGQGSLVCAGAILNPGAIVGENVIVNTGAIVDHDCHIESHAHIAPGVTLSGNVWVQQGAHVGTGASVRQGIVIGKGAVVGAGAVVVNDVAPNTLVKGIPARV